jgi:CDP-glucose 4,6-dehydratase
LGQFEEFDVKINEYEWKNSKVLVTGASGFKGSWLSAVLLRLGAKVYGTARPQKNPLSAYNILKLDKHIIKVTADISDRQQVYDMINSVEPDVIFHLAAKALVPVSLRDPRRTFEINVMGTVNIIEACRKLKVCSRLLICSTDHVFGSVSPSELPKGGFDEGARVSYGGPYDTSKAAMELAVRCYHYTYWSELPAIGITRCANVFGNGDTNQRRIIPLFVHSSVAEKVIPLRFRANGRQFIHITDTTAGYIKAASKLNEGGCAIKSNRPRPVERSPFTPTYHFAIELYENTSHPYIRVDELAKLTASIHGSEIDESQCVELAPNENEIQALNCSATRKSIGWEPRKDMRTGLTELGEWYQNLGNIDALERLIETDIERIYENLIS